MRGQFVWYQGYGGLLEVSSSTGWLSRFYFTGVRFAVVAGVVLGYWQVCFNTLINTYLYRMSGVLSLQIMRVAANP